ncbi:MAG TPA: heparinase II/III-family protein [Anaeromyxobacter sp.]
MGTIGYYGFLATRIAPSRLLEVAARRVARAARNRVAPPIAPQRDRLLSVLGCDGAATLARLLARPRPCRAPWTPASLRAALDEHLPGEAERATARAEDAACGRIAVFGRVFPVVRPDGRGTDWQLDPVNGGRFAGWAPSRALPPAPGLDARLAWAVGRGEQWVAIAQGAVLDARRRRELSAAVASSVSDFVAENPVGHGVHWSSAMEAGLRAWNLVLALWLLSAAGAQPGPELAVDAARLLVATGRFVLANLEDDAAVPDSRLAADWLGLLACAEGLPEWPESARWRVLARDGLAASLRDQVHDDGTARDGALPYQRLAAEVFAAGAILSHGAGRPVGSAFARRLAALLGATRTLLAAGGAVPQIGEADAPRVLALRDRAPADAGNLLPLAAALLRAPALLVAPGPGDAADVAWLLGPRPLAALAAARQGDRPRSASFAAAGLHVLRRGPFEVFVSCGPNGQRGVGGHSHNDKLALELRADGALGVCDGGTPSAGGDPELRDAFRSTRAHATVVVDGLEQAPLLRERPGALPDVTAARLLAFEPGGTADRLVGEHRGFARAGVVHRREVLVAEAGVAIVDRLAGAGTHRVELRWPFASAGARLRPVAAQDAAALDRLARAVRLQVSIARAHAVEVPLGDRRLVLVFALPPGLVPEVAPAVHAPGYGHLAHGAVALVAGTVRCPAALATLLVVL